MGAATSRHFPSTASGAGMDPDLQQSLKGLVQAIALEDASILTTGVLDSSSGKQLLRKWLQCTPQPNMDSGMTALSKRQVVALMSVGLRTCQENVRQQTLSTRKRTLEIRQAFLDLLQVPPTGNDDKSQMYKQRP